MILSWWNVPAVIESTLLFSSTLWQKASCCAPAARDWSDIGVPDLERILDSLCLLFLQNFYGLFEGMLEKLELNDDGVGK